TYRHHHGKRRKRSFSFAFKTFHTKSKASSDGKNIFVECFRCLWRFFIRSSKTKTFVKHREQIYRQTKKAFTNSFKNHAYPFYSHRRKRNAQPCFGASSKRRKGYGQR